MKFQYIVPKRLLRYSMHEHILNDRNTGDMNQATESDSFQVLLVEDDVRLAQLIQEYLDRYEFEVNLEHRGDRALERVRQERPDLLILDLMLPGKDGLEICRELRPDYPGPILILTARDEDVDQVVGLELGADDYVTKPVQPRVLLARLRSLTRRYSLVRTEEATAPAVDEPLLFGQLRIEPQGRTTRLSQQTVELSSGEYELLWLLASHAGQVLSRDTILKRLRGIGYDGLDRSVDIGVSRLRRKLGDDTGHPFRIKTVRGKGYLFVPDAWS